MEAPENIYILSSMLCRNRGRLMAKLTTKTRKRLPKSDFGMPGSRKYPMDTEGRAVVAKGRATQMVKKGKLSASTASKIKAKANRVLKGAKK